MSMFCVFANVEPGVANNEVGLVQFSPFHQTVPSFIPTATTPCICSNGVFRSSFVDLRIKIPLNNGVFL